MAEWLGCLARKGGASPHSAIYQKKKKPKSCNRHQKKTKFVKFLRRQEPAAPRLPAGFGWCARLGWAGGDPNTP